MRRGLRTGVFDTVYMKAQCLSEPPQSHVPATNENASRVLIVTHRTRENHKYLPNLHRYLPQKLFIKVRLRGISDSRLESTRDRMPLSRTHSSRNDFGSFPMCVKLAPLNQASDSKPSQTFCN
jgi:hypothetical protein